MPVTKTAKRALRVSKRKRAINEKRMTAFEVSVRIAKKTKTIKAIKKAISMVDRAAKRNIIHKNKAARIKSQLSKLTKLTPATKKASSSKKTASK